MKTINGSINFNLECKGIEWGIKSHLSKDEVKFLQSDKVGLGYNRKTGKFYVGLKQVESLERLHAVYVWMVKHTEGAEVDEKTFKKIFGKETVFGNTKKTASIKQDIPEVKAEVKTEVKPNYSKMTKAQLIALLEAK